MNNTNGYTSVSSWRDDVSKSLGGMEKGISNIEKKIDTICDVQKKHHGRIDALEGIESNRKAVNKRLNAIWAAIIVAVSAVANIAFEVFN